MGAGAIIIRGAAEHNLRDLDVDLPHGRLIVLSGVSGSGKSSLAFDTLYTEARRRYLLAAGGAGQALLRQLRAPRVRRLEGLMPAVAIAQGRARQSPRSTVAILAGIYDYMRLLFARVGRAHCLVCGAVLEVHRFEEVYEVAAGLPEGTRLAVLAPRRLQEAGDFAALVGGIEQLGYRRVRLKGELVLLEELEPKKIQGRMLEVVVDRLVVGPRTRRRLRGSLQAALEVGAGQVILWPEGSADSRFAVRPGCPVCGASFRPLVPALFSFNSARGACGECRGTGMSGGLSFAGLFAGGELSVEEALGPLWRQFGHEDLRRSIHACCRRCGVDADAPVGEWGAEERARLWEGAGGRRGFAGVRRWLERRRNKAEGRERRWLEEQLEDAPCPACAGRRLVPEALAVEVRGENIEAVAGRSIAEAAAFFAGLEFEEPQEVAGAAVTAQILGRLQTLNELGLGYLELGRRADSLSSGEFQRLRLGAALGSGMTQVLYVFDEPSVGLHARDAARLLQALQGLRDAGNTVLVVEHDLALVAAADYMVDMGPGAAAEGGRIVAQGAPAQLRRTASPTGRYLGGGASLEARAGRRPGRGGWLELEGLSGYNLKNISVAFPLGNLVCVTGVSGSGKSTLVHQTLYPLLAARLQGAERRALPCAACRGGEHLERVVAVDQKPIGRTSRSTAATYTGLLGALRALYAQLPEARLRGYRPGHFSFNAPEGACPECGGSGLGAAPRELFEDLEVLCPLCEGRRYKSEVLEIRYRRHSIAGVLELSVREALEVFAALPEVARRLKLLAEVGLGYLRLGQPATRFSGGEAQRVKLAAELSRPRRAHTLYILDEPTTGLHMEDVGFLLELLQRLVDEDNSAIVVEHHIELIAAADYVIDLGPEGGEGGGRVVAAGTPRQVAAVEASWTGRYLREYFERIGGPGEE